MKIKQAADKHTRKVGFLTRTITEKVNIDWYYNTILKMTDLTHSKVELRQELVYEGDIWQLSIVAHSIESEAK